MHPKLYESVQHIVGQRVQLPSKKDELLGNFKLSVRGSIRKAPNVVPGAECFFSVCLLYLMLVFVECGQSGKVLC